MTDPRGICPPGWRVPSQGDWLSLGLRSGPWIAEQGFAALPEEGTETATWWTSSAVDGEGIVMELDRAPENDGFFAGSLVAEIGLRGLNEALPVRCIKE